MVHGADIALVFTSGVHFCLLTSQQLTLLLFGAYHIRLTSSGKRALLRSPVVEHSFIMEKKKLEYFKKRLETRQHELRTMVSRNDQEGRSADQEATQDIADRAASSYNKEFLFSQSNNDRQLLQMVDGALARIREGSFGECISCGKEINSKRLEAVPWTRHCIECQEKLEKGQLEHTR